MDRLLLWERITIDGHRQPVGAEKVGETLRPDLEYLRYAVSSDCLAVYFNASWRVVDNGCLLRPFCFGVN